MLERLSETTKSRRRKFGKTVTMGKMGHEDTARL
jgi:hypothetical protein